ncbi:MAG TPA: ABC-2 family transporter protein [Actinopolymorphaceae bacterium]
MRSYLGVGRLYAGVGRRNFRRYSGYRMATFAGAFTNTIFGCIMAYTYIALWSARPQLGGYDVAEAVTYVWIGQALLAPMAMFGGGFQEELGERIRNGDVAIDLYRPIDLQLWWLSADLGRAAFHLLGRGIPPTVAGALLFPHALPGSPMQWGAFLVAVALGLLVSFSLRYLVALCGFWLLDMRGLQTAAGVVAMFMSGMLLPLTVFPTGLAELTQALPWSSVLQVPADVLLGKHEGRDLVLAFVFQAGWALVLLLAGRALTAVATTKVVVQGG